MVPVILSPELLDRRDRGVVLHAVRRARRERRRRRSRAASCLAAEIVEAEASCSRP